MNSGTALFMKKRYKKGRGRNKCFPREILAKRGKRGRAQVDWAGWGQTKGNAKCKRNSRTVGFIIYLRGPSEVAFQPRLAGTYNSSLKQLHSPSENPLMSGSLSIHLLCSDWVPWKPGLWEFRNLLSPLLSWLSFNTQHISISTLVPADSRTIRTLIGLFGETGPQNYRHLEWIWW